MRWLVVKVRGIAAWVRRRPKKVTIPAALVILAALSFGAYKGVAAYNYMENNPNFCRACHTMEEAWDRWQTSEHRSVNCHECHETNLIEGARQLIVFSLSRPERAGKHATVQDDACERCHESGDPKWMQVAATVGHRVHAEEQNIACTKCHSVTLHRFAPPGPICLVCHEEKHIEVTEMADMHCTACHDYLAETAQLLPTREGCLRCHLALTELGVTWPEDAPMQFPCGQCHKPHEQAKPTVDCLSCHGDVRSEAIHSVMAHAASKCQTCHRPHQWQITGRETCLSCHADRAEHNPGVECATCHTSTGPLPSSKPAGATPTPPMEATPTPATAIPTPPPGESPVPPSATPTPPAEATPTPPAATPTPPPEERVAPAGPPQVPHPLEGRSECTLCHGPAGLKPFPPDHEGRTRETCLMCHQQQ